MSVKYYITRDESGYSSSHPKVDKIWAWGGRSASPSSIIEHNVTIIMKDGTRYDFGPNELSVDTDIQVNNFLNTIPE